MKATGVPVKYKRAFFVLKQYDPRGHSKHDWKKTWFLVLQDSPDHT